MANSLDLTSLLPNRNRDRTIDGLLKNLFNRFLSKPDTVPLYGFVGDQSELSPGEVQITETDLERQINQLEPFIFSQHASEKIVTSWFDLIQKLVVLGVDYTTLNQWFNSKSYNFVPPIDLDKFCNFQNYFWIGNWFLTKPALDYTSLGFATVSTYHVAPFAAWNNSTLSPEYYVIARGPLQTNGAPIAPQPTFSNSSSWSDWSYGNLWVHRADLINFANQHKIDVSISTAVQATRPIIEYSAYVGLNVAQTSAGVPTDAALGTGVPQAKQFMNQLPLFDLYYYDKIHAGVTSSIFYYTEAQDQPVDSVIGRRLTVDANGDFIFGHSLVNSIDNSLYFYKLYDTVTTVAGSHFKMLTIWREGPDDAIKYVKYDTSGSLIDLDKFVNFSNYFWVGIDATPQPSYNPTGLPEYYTIAKGGTSDWSVYNYWTHVSALNRADLTRYVQATKPIIEFNVALESQLVVYGKTVRAEMPIFKHFVFDQPTQSFQQIPRDNDNDAYLAGHLFARLSDLPASTQAAVTTNPEIYTNNCFSYNNEIYIQGLFNGSYYAFDTSLNFYGYKSRLVSFNGEGNGSATINALSSTAYPELIVLTYNGTSFNAVGSVSGDNGFVDVGVETSIQGITIKIDVGSTPYAIGDVYTFEITSYVFSPVNIYVYVNGVYRTLNSPIQITTQVQNTTVVETDVSRQDGVWTPPPQLEWNILNETRSTVSEGDLYYHLTSIIAAQPGLIGSATGTNNWRTLSPDVGLGGKIKQFDGNTALLISMLMQRGISTLSLIEFARESYQAFSTSIRTFVQDILPDMIAAGQISLPKNVPAGIFVNGQSYVITEIGTTDFTAIGASSNSIGLSFIATGPGDGTGSADENSIDSEIVSSFMTYFSRQSPLVLSTSTPVDDTISSPFYDSTAEIFNLVITLPYMGLTPKALPQKIFDADLNLEMLVHHDGHRTKLESNPTDLAKKLAQKLYVRSPGESTPGFIAADYPVRPYAGQFWFNTITGKLFIFDAVSDSGELLSGVKYGAYSYDRSTNQVWQTDGQDWTLLTDLQSDRLPWTEVKLDLIINNLELNLETELFDECPTLNPRVDEVGLQAYSNFSSMMDAEFQSFGIRHNINDIYSNPQIYAFWTKTLEYLYSLQKTYFKLDPLTYVRESWGVKHLTVDEYTLNPQLGRKEAPPDFTLHGEVLDELAQSSWVSASLVNLPPFHLTPGQSYIITSVGTTDWTLWGAYANEVGVQFTVPLNAQIGPGSGTGTASVLPPLFTRTYYFKCANRTDGMFYTYLDDEDAARELTEPLTNGYLPYYGYTPFSAPPLKADPVFSEAIGNDLTYRDKYLDVTITATRRGFFWGDIFKITVTSDGVISVETIPQQYFKAEGFNQLFVQYGRIYGEDASLSINTTLLKDWSVKLGYRFGGMVNTDTLTVKTQDTIDSSGYNVYLKENLFNSSSWINALRVQVVQKGATEMLNGVSVPVIGFGGSPGEDWIFRIDNYNKNRTSLSWYNYDLVGDQHKFIALDGLATDYYEWARYTSKTTISTLNAPFLITGIQNLINFVFGYADKLEADGWRFNDPNNPRIDPTTGLHVGYQSLVESFIVQQFSGVNAGSVFVFNPFGQKVWFETSHGFVSNVNNVLGFETETVNAILDQNAKQVSKNDIRVFRQDDITEMVFDTPVYTLHLLTSEFEHVVLFENKATNTLLIYDPFLGQRVSRIFMSGQKQANFSGQIDFGGHFLLGNEMKKNIESSVNSIINLYDTTVKDVDSQILDRSRSLLGYQKKSYFDVRGTTDTSQFRFWQGMIANKGTNFSVDAFINSASYHDAILDEYWAYKVAEYGDSRSIIKTELLVQPEDCIGEYANFIFLESDDISTQSTDSANLYDNVVYDYNGFSASSQLDVTGLIPVSATDETRWFSYSDLNTLSYLEAQPIATMFLPSANQIAVGSCFVITDSNGRPVRADRFEIINFNSTSASTIIFREAGDYIVGTNPPDFSLPRFERLNQSVIKILDLGGDLTQAVNLIPGLAYNIISQGTSTDFTLIGAANNNVGTSFVATGPGYGNGVATISPIVLGVTAIIVGQTYTITTLGNTDFTLIGAAANLVGVTFTAVNVGVGTGTVTAVSALTSAGSFVIGVTYTINTTGVLTDFTQVGAPNNNVGTEFIATAAGTGSGTAATVVVTGSLQVVAYGPASSWYSPNLLYDYVNNVLVKNDIIWWDPGRGIHHPQAAASISYDLDSDPAIYTSSLLSDAKVSNLKPWGSAQVGKIWWNTENLHYKPYSDDKQVPQVKDRIASWGALSDMSSIEIYEWVKSQVPPSSAVLGQSMNGEPAITNTLTRTRTWWQRPVAWRYSSNPDITPRAFLQYQPSRLQITYFNGVGQATLKTGSFDTLGIMIGTKISGTEYSSTTKLDNVLSKIFGLAIVSSTSTTVVGTTGGYADGPGFTNNATFSNFQAVLDQNVLKYRTTSLGQYALSTSADLATVSVGSLNVGTDYTITSIGQTSPTTAGYLVIGKTYVIVSIGSTTNFMLVGASANTPGVEFVATGISSGDGTAMLVTNNVNATALIPGFTYVITNTGTTDFTAVGASANTNGTVFIATAATTGSGTCSTANTDFTTVGAITVSPGSFVSGQTYVIKAASTGGTSTNFTLIGAPNNTPGTTFTASFIGADPTTGTGRAYNATFTASSTSTTGTGTAQYSVNTYLSLTHVSSGESQKLKVINSTRSQGQTLSYNFDALGVQVSATLGVNLPHASTIVSGLVSGNADINLRSSVTVKIPMIFNDGTTTFTEFFSNTDTLSQLGWIAWNDPTTNPNLGNPPPKNLYEPLVGDWVQVGSNLHAVSDDIVLRISDPWTWFDGLDYTPYKSSWTAWTKMSPTIIEAYNL
jgi:hypothetical protein